MFARTSTATAFKLSMPGASPYQQRLAGGLGLLVLVIACIYRWGDGLNFRRSQVVSQSPAVAATMRPPADDRVRLPEARPTEVSIPAPEPSIEPVRPDAIDTASDAVRARANTAMARAQTARAEGRLLLPEDDSALHWINEALAIAPKSQRARAAFNALIERLLDAAIEALDHGRPEPARILIEAVGSERGEFNAKLSALSDRLSTAVEVRRLLLEANERIGNDALFAPSGSSALESYRAAIALDPRSRAAQEGLQFVAAGVVEEALNAAAREKQADALGLLDLAASIDARHPGLSAARQRVRGIQEARTLTLAARVRTALEGRQLDLAAELLARLRVVGFDLPQNSIEALEERLQVLQQYAGHAPGELFRDAFLDHSARGPAMVAMPTGEFRMGSPPTEPNRRTSEGPVRRVRVSRPFALGWREVTVEEFGEFVAATDYETRAQRSGYSFVWDERNGRLVRRNDIDWTRGYSGRKALPDAPVMHVSWGDADAFVRWLGLRTGEAYRLPSEAELEFALRAGTETRYPWGDGIPASAVENIAGTSDRSPSGRSWQEGFVDYSDGFWGPAPAGYFPPNAFGLRDSAGNLSEWSADCWHDSYRRAPADTTAWINPGCTQRVVRGASWGSSPAEARAAYRSSQLPSARSARLGFRVARDL